MAADRHEPHTHTHTGGHLQRHNHVNSQEANSEKYRCVTARKPGDQTWATCTERWWHDEIEKKKKKSAGAKERPTEAKHPVARIQNNMYVHAIDRM